MIYVSGQRIESQFAGSHSGACLFGNHEFNPNDKGTILGNTEVRNRDLEGFLL